jgi:Holliday junction DNA helicase RuvA
VKIPGVGKKTAERLVLELGDKLSAWQTVGNAGVQTGTVKASLFAVSAQSEAESALVGLGYKPVQASKAVSAAVKSAPDGSCEDLIRLSLKGMI